jgi:hypothetical protein
MRHSGRLAALLVVTLLGILYASRSDAQPFYTGSGTNMFRVFGCAPNATLNLNGTGPAQQGDCTIYQTGNIVPAVPIEAWVSAQVSGAATDLRAQNEKLQRQVDELTARVQALEDATNQTPRNPCASRPQPGSGTK